MHSQNWRAKDVPDEVGEAYGRKLKFGPEYLIPAPFDPRLIVAVPQAVANAAMETGVARRPIIDMDAYTEELKGRLDPTYDRLQRVYDRARGKGQRVVFAEGEDPRAIRAALAVKNGDLGRPILVGRQEDIEATLSDMGIDPNSLEIRNAGQRREDNPELVDMVYARLNRKGYLRRDCQRLIHQDRNVYAASLVASGQADAMVTGLTRAFGSCFEDVLKVVDPAENQRIMTHAMFIRRGQTVFLADTSVAENPDGRALADIAIQTANTARSLGFEPRVALLSYSNFGQPERHATKDVRDAVLELERRRVDFEFDGEMQVNVALDYDLIQIHVPVLPPHRAGKRAGHAEFARGKHQSKTAHRVCRRHGDRSSPARPQSRRTNNIYERQGFRRTERSRVCSHRRCPKIRRLIKILLISCGYMLGFGAIYT